MNTIEYPTVRWARELPDHPAVIHDGREVTYKQLESFVRVAATQLASSGVDRGDRLILCAPNSLEWIIAAHAIVRLGAVCVPISTRASDMEFGKYLEFFRPALVIVADTSHVKDVRVLRLSELVAEHASADHVPREIDPDCMHSIILTSGSEGEPKGVCLTFRNHLSSALGSALNLGVHPDDRWLLNLPLDRIGGFAIAQRAAIYGITCVVHETFDAEAVWSAFKTHRVTQLSVVATTMQRILSAHPTGICPSHVRSVLIGGGPVPKTLIDESRRRGFPVLPTYGLTESASQIATLSRSAPESKRHTAGHALPLAEITIRDEAGIEREEESQGTIWLRGPMIASGFWDVSGSVVPITDSSGWLRTRDIGSIDRDGYLTVHGRLDQVIISGGLKVHPEEVENVLAAHPDVARVVVVGQPDAEWGQSVTAIVECVKGRSLSAENIAEFVATTLPGHKQPKRVVFVSELPTLPSGKPDRQAIARVYST